MVREEEASGPPDKVSIFRLSGYLDAAGALKLEDQTQWRLGKQPKNVLLDLDEIPYICSVGIGVLIGILNKVKSRGGRVAVVHLQPDVSKILKLVGFLKMAKAYESEPEALIALGS